MTNPIFKRTNHSNFLDERHPKQKKIFHLFHVGVVSARIFSESEETVLNLPQIQGHPILQNTKFLFLLDVLKNESNTLSEAIVSILIDRDEKMETKYLEEKFTILTNRIWQITSNNLREDLDANILLSERILKISMMLDEETEKTAKLKRILTKTNEFIIKCTPFISIYEEINFNIHSEILKYFSADSPLNITTSFEQLLTIYPKRPQLLGTWIDNNKIPLKDLRSLDKFKVLIPYLNHIDLRGYILKEQFIKYIPNASNLLIDCGQINLKLIFRLTQLCKLQLENINPDYQHKLAGISVLTNLTQLDLSGCEEMTEEGDSHISSLIQLKVLSLSTHQMENLHFLNPLTNLESLDLSECDNLEDENFSNLESLVNLKILNIKECAKLTFDLFIYLKSFTQLKKLIFSSLNDAEENNNENFRLVTHLVNLNHLEISNCEITDNDSAYIGKLFNLKYLSIVECPEITDVFFNYINCLTHLTELKIENCEEITAEGFVYLPQLKNLKVLHLNNCGITQSGIFNISTFEPLQSLSLFSSEHIKDEHLKSLARLVNLEFLALHFCRQITNKGILYLYALPRLKLLNIEHNNKITNEGIKALNEKILSKKIKIIH
ncbi:MAG: hypothetical protein H0V82_08950 [Candidatus Protochlamydia sp.]|nr:hypothetical protein [Candidatus Protochlamydia sp.]